MRFFLTHDHPELYSATMVVSFAMNAGFQTASVPSLLQGAASRQTLPSSGTLSRFQAATAPIRRMIKNQNILS